MQMLGFQSCSEGSTPSGDWHEQPQLAVTERVVAALWLDGWSGETQSFCWR
jgi:hypothetical protein